MVMAVWQHGGLGFRGEEIVDLWTIQGGGNLDIMPLCKKAGVLLLQSPRVSQNLSIRVRSEADQADRWLYFLKDSNALKLDKHTGVAVGQDKRQRVVVMGQIDNLGAVSARVCRNCSAEEL